MKIHQVYRHDVTKIKAKIVGVLPNGRLVMLNTKTKETFEINSSYLDKWIKI